MSEKIKLILSLSISGSILAAVIFTAKPFIKNRLSKSIQYYIWLVVLLRLVLPFSFEASIMNRVFYSDNTPQTVVTEEGEQFTNEAVNNAQILLTEEKASDGAAVVVQPIPAAKNNSIISVLKNNPLLIYGIGLLIWMIGALASFAANILSYARFAKFMRNANTPAAEEETILLRGLLGKKKNVTLARNKFAATPMLIGIFKPCIIIPDIAYTSKQLRNILLHELTHLRRFDIVIKWLTVTAVSIHWFNPLMYFIKKEINNACELSCDEGVIKNLSDEERQDYGDTLISMVAEHKYPIGILSTTMCEEKKTLKERLLSIMNHGRKSKLVITASVILLAGVICVSVVLGAGVGIGADLKKPPNIYISAGPQEMKDAVMGGYSWTNKNSAVNEIIHADFDHPTNFKYKNENIVSLSSGQQFTLSTRRFKSDKRYDFTIDNLEVYKDGKLVQLDTEAPRYIYDSMYFQGPKEPGEYIYCLILEFKDKGEVNYGFVVRVDMPVYDLAAIEKYKTPYIGNHSKVGNIIGLLPLPDNNFRQQYMSMVTSTKPYKLTVYYEGDSITNSKINSVLQNNALVLFYMIDNLDEVTFAFRYSPSDGELDTSKYETMYTFSREDIKKAYGDQIFELKDVNELQQILDGKGNSISTEIDRLLEIIMSSPKEASYSGAYIEAHREEYNLIVGMSDKALPYLIDIMNSGEQGLKENIVNTICEDIVKKLIRSENTNAETVELIKEAKEAIKLHEFTKEEVASARAVVEEYYRAIAAKEDKAILATIHESRRFNNMELYGSEKRTLKSIDYNSQDYKRKNYGLDDSAVTPDNIIIFRVSFNIEYPNGEGGPWNEGMYDNWSMILIREDQNNPWYIYDQGY